MRFIRVTRIFPDGSRLAAYIREEDILGVGVVTMTEVKEGVAVRTFPASSVIASRGAATFECAVEETADVLFSKLKAEVV